MKLTTSNRKRFRVKNKIKKVAKSDRFRICVSRSTKNISAQIIDDKNSKTLFSASSIEKDIKNLNVKNKSEIYKFLIEKEYFVVFNKKENYIFKRKKIMY